MAHQLKISLRNSKPSIYRTIIVPEKSNFHQLHLAIQCVMNWEDYHLYQFSLGTPYKSDTIKLAGEDDDYFYGESKHKTFPADETLLSDFFNGQYKQLIYTYDMGDDWEHIVMPLKKPSEEVLYPICINGENAAPVEDCGGIYGFYEMLEALNDPKNTARKKELLNWLELSKGESYERVFGFKLNEVNKLLQDTFKVKNKAKR